MTVESRRTRLSRRRMLGAGLGAVAALVAFPGIVLAEQDGKEAPPLPVKNIVFGPEYVGKDPDREAQAAQMLSIIWDSAGKSKTLAARAAYFEKYTQSSPAKLTEYREGRTVSGIVDLEVRAPDLSVWRLDIAKPDTAVDHLVGVFPADLSQPDGSSLPIFNLKHILLVGNTDHRIDEKSIQMYAEYLLLPYAMINATNQAAGDLVRSGVKDPLELNRIVVTPESDFNKEVRAKAWNIVFKDVRGAYVDNPDWESSESFRALYQGWLRVADQGEDEQLNYTRTIPFIRN